MDHLWCLVPVCRLRPWPGPGVRLRLLGPVESGPDGAGGVVGVAAPRVGDGADDVQAVVPGWAGHGLVPGAVVVLDFDPGVVAWADGGADGEGSAGQAGTAVLGGVGPPVRGAQDSLLCPPAVAKESAPARPDTPGWPRSAPVGRPRAA